MGLASDIKKAAAGHGHGCFCDACLAEQNSRGHYGFDKVLAWRLLAGVILFLAALTVKAAWPMESFLLSIAAILAAGYDVLIRTAANCARNKAPDEDLLMTVAVIAAAAISRALEGALIILLMQAGTLVRGYVLEKVRRTVASATDGGTLHPDEAGKSRAEEFVIHFCHIYTPIILGLAVLMAVVLPLIFRTTVAEAIYRALVLMVIACPCAFVISIPLAYRAGIGGASRHGVLFRGDAAMEDLCGVGTVVFDKAAALEGEGLRVVSVKSDRMDAETLLRIAAHACAYSDEPYAESVKAAYQGTIYIELIQSFRRDPGEGIAVEVDGVGILLGTEAFVKKNGVDPGQDAVLEPSVYLSIDGQYAGRVLFGSVPREDAARAVQHLSWDNERQILLVSEDTPSATERFARSVAVGQYYADCDGEKKAAIIRDLKERKTRKGGLLFVGSVDADAAAMAEADLAAAMDAAGSETALDTADVSVMGSSPYALVLAIEAARRTKSIVTQNILFALAFKLIVLALDILGVCPLWLAVFADPGVSLAVILNCLRALEVRQSLAPTE